MIKTFRARNYGCLKDVTAELTPLHAFIGPNDSGKSTLLHGMRTLFQLASGKFSEDNGWSPFDPYLPIRFPVTSGQREDHDFLLACGFEHGWYAYVVDHGGPHERVARSLEEITSGTDLSYDASRFATWPGELHHHASDTADTPGRVAHQLGAARLIRFDPDALRKASGLIPEREAVGFQDDRGHGLAGVYFAIRNRDDDAFSAIVKDVRHHFPTIKSVRVKAVTTSEVVLEAELVSGARVEARRMSEGLLYYLAFAALRHLDPVSLLLVEEPENGLHPARIAEVVRILRAIAETGTQVVMATHSPLVVNELRPEEVSVITRTPEQGTRVKRIHETPDFEARSKIYALGELWIAYANGEDESPLLEGTEP
jgi:predicted ATPase